MGIVGPVCALAGLLVGVSIMVFVGVIKNKQHSRKNKNSIQMVDNSKNRILTEGARSSTSEVPNHLSNESMTNIAFPSEKYDNNEKLNPMETMPSEPKKLATFLKGRSMHSTPKKTALWFHLEVKHVSKRKTKLKNYSKQRYKNQE